MRPRTHFGCIPLLAMAIACCGEERESQSRQTEPAAEPAAVERAADQIGRGTESGETSTPAKSTADEPPEEAADAGAAAGAEQPAAGNAAAGPRGVAPVTEGDEPGLRNWLLIEFARAIESADLEWLEQNGFRVDTVLSATTVRGWLEDPAGGAAIGKDPRIARIDAQMR